MVTPLRLLVVVVLTGLLVWSSRKATRWLVDSVLARRGLDIGMREAVGVIGEVREIGARATTIVTDENVATLVPNSQLVSERVTNWSRPGRLTAYLMPFHVSYSSDPLVVRNILLAAAVAHSGVLADPPPQVEFAEVGPATLRFQLQVSVQPLPPGLYFTFPG